MHITVFKSARDTSPIAEECDWSDLVELMRDSFQVKRKRDDKLDSPAMIAGLCQGKRANANVRHLSFFCGDFDIAPDDPRYRSFSRRCQWLSDEGYQYIAYTTTANCVTHNRYRVLIPLPCNVPAAKWLPVWRACSAVFDEAIDRATKDLARLSFLPANWQGNPFWDEGKGKRITLDLPTNSFHTSPQGNSRPILSQAEVEGLLASPQMPQDAFYLSQAPEIAELSRSASQRPQDAFYVPQALSPAEIAELSRSAPQDAPCWRLIGRLATSPLVSPWMRDELPRFEGSRFHKFCLYAALTALRHRIPITPHILADLAGQWSAEYLSRPAPADALRQAENALTYAYRNPPRDTQPEGSSGNSTSKDE